MTKLRLGYSLHDRRFMSQAGRTRYFARSATPGEEKNIYFGYVPLFFLAPPTFLEVTWAAWTRVFLSALPLRWGDERLRERGWLRKRRQTADVLIKSAYISFRCIAACFETKISIGHWGDCRRRTITIKDITTKATNQQIQVVIRLGSFRGVQ